MELLTTFLGRLCLLGLFRTGYYTFGLLLCYSIPLGLTTVQIFAAYLYGFTVLLGDSYMHLKPFLKIKFSARFLTVRVECDGGLDASMRCVLCLSVKRLIV